MTNINTLITDIYRTIGGKGEKELQWFTPDLAHSFASEVESRLSVQFGREGPRVDQTGQDPTSAQAAKTQHNTRKGTLRLSQMGPRCPRALWASVHAPGEAEDLPPWAQIKYSYGHILEALVISLAKAAGHEVTGEQDELVVDGIKGHRDCVIDGCLVDVKSASSIAFQKFKDRSIGLSDATDPFGYLDQLDGYLVGSLDDPLVRVKDRAYLLAVDKTLGHLVLYEHKLRNERIRKRIAESKRIVELADPPSCTCGTIADGKSGNIRLDTKASYNVFKYFCRPSLRTFLYADGPRYLTKVVRRPDVPEIDRYGKIIS